MSVLDRCHSKRSRDIPEEIGGVCSFEKFPWVLGFLRHPQSFRRGLPSHERQRIWRRAFLGEFESTGKLSFLRFLPAMMVLEEHGCGEVKKSYYQAKWNKAVICANGHFRSFRSNARCATRLLYDHVAIHVT